MSISKRILIIAILNLATLALLVYVLSQAVNLARDNSAMAFQITDLKNKEAGLADLKRESSRLNDSLEILKQYFVFSDQKVLVIDQLESLAKQAGVEYELNNANEKNNLSLDISAKGRFRDVYYFLKLVETSGYRVSFDKLSLSRQQTGSWMLNMSLVLLETNPL